MPGQESLRRLALAAAMIAAGCSGPPRAVTESQERATAAPSAREFDLTGIVRVVESSERLVSIDHGDIPGLMPAMLMDFQVDPALLEDVYPGDEVQGRLRATYDGSGRLEDLRLVDLVVTRAAPPPEAPAPEPPPVLRPGEPAPDFAVTTQEDRVLHLSDLRGQVVVLTFVYTRCPLPDYCPLMDRRFSELAELASRTADRAGKIRLVSVSFDPEHDTPRVLADHAARVGARPPLWTYAVASHEELARVGPSLGLSYAPMTGQIRHNLSTVVIAPDGTVARIEEGNQWRPSDLFETIRERIDRR